MFTVNTIIIKLCIGHNMREFQKWERWLHANIILHPNTRFSNTLNAIPVNWYTDASGKCANMFSKLNDPTQKYT